MTALTHSETPNERIGRAILAVAASRGLSKIPAIADALGMTDDTLRRRLNGETKKGWLASELLIIAEVLDVSVSLLLESDPESWFRPDPSAAVTLSDAPAPVRRISTQKTARKTPKGRNTVYCSETRGKSALKPAA